MRGLASRRREWARAWPPLLLLSYSLLPYSLGSGWFCGGDAAVKMNKVKEVRSPLWSEVAVPANPANQIKTNLVRLS
jgi:hypothetical protein